MLYFLGTIIYLILYLFLSEKEEKKFLGILINLGLSLIWPVPVVTVLIGVKMRLGE